MRVRVIGLGLISALGDGPRASEAALRAGRPHLGRVRLFPLARGASLPVGEADFPDDAANPLPRCHQLALHAARQALAGSGPAPDAVVLGTTTGGMLTTERFLAAHEARPGANPYHSLHTVTAAVAELAGCRGPALTVSTACSSGALALALALRLLRSGRAGRVLAGGVDSLCRLTYFGFHALQLVDADRPKPFDRRRGGMAVAEGAAFLLLTSGREGRSLAELAGAGLSCDAFHETRPHPEGEGALAAMQDALDDAGLQPEAIDYISLHGTATVDNDRAEARALHRLLGPLVQGPPLASIKGACGHSLAAAGALSAAVGALALQHGFVPANTGFAEADPDLAFVPQIGAEPRRLRAALVNAFGFGGNNGALVLTAPEAFPPRPADRPGLPLTIRAVACLSGAGDLNASLARLDSGRGCAGLVDDRSAFMNLPPRQIRRLKRLARLGLALSLAARPAAARTQEAAVFFGTGWGALSETADFLDKLQASQQQFASPTDFVGSVHNAPASQIALLLGARGPNITTSGGSRSFAEAAFAATLLAGRHEGEALLAGADEYHAQWSPMLDAGINSKAGAEGGGALWLGHAGDDALALLRHCALYGDSSALPALLADLGGAAAVQNRVGLILADTPDVAAEAQLAELKALLPIVPVWAFREHLGRFASAAALAAALAVAFLHRGHAPALTTGSAQNLPLAGRSALLVGLGHTLSAMEFARP